MADAPLKLDVRMSGLSVLAFDHKELRKALRQIGNEVARGARALVRGAGARTAGIITSRTGALRKSIKVFVFKSGEGVAVRARRYYSAFLEHGAHGPGRRVLAPRPFMSKALDARQSDIRERLTDAVDRGIKLVPRRGKPTR